MGPAGTQTDNLETEIMTVDMVTHIYNPSIQESETRGPEIHHVLTKTGIPDIM